MNYIIDFVTNPLIAAPFWAWFSAQVLKWLIYAFLNRDFRLDRLMGDGGMPSSHSATVMGIVTAAGMVYGLGSAEFAIPLVFSIIVMHDAMGVRWETGVQAKVLNSMIELFTDMGKKMPVEDKLKEFVGHTPLQVMMGAILGIIVGIVVCLIIGA